MIGVKVIQSSQIKKGDGNFGFFGGDFQNQRFPPADAHNDDPNIPDVPPFAHTGALHENETGIPGTGKVIPGNFQQGRYGEHVYQDESGGEHLHGIDGVIRAIGVALEQQGIHGADAKQVVQKAIEDYNNQHHDEKNKLPHVDDTQWRKNVVSAFQHGDAMNRGNYGTNGEFITATTNSHGQNHKHGTYLESCTVPMHNQLESVLSSIGFQDPRQINCVKYPYIGPENLHFITNPKTGQLQSGGYRIPSGHMKGGSGIPSHLLDKFSDLGIPQQAFKDITSWDVMHHLPDPYFLPPVKGKGAVNTVRSAKFHIEQALGLHPDAIGTHIHQSISPSDIKEQWNGQPLGALLSTDAGRTQIAQELARYPAFVTLFGESRPKSHAGKLHNAYSELMGGGDRDIEYYLQHSAHKADVFRPYEGKRTTLTTGHNARKIWAKALLSGHAPTESETDANSNFRNHDLSPEELAAMGIGLDSSPEAKGNVPAVRRIIEYLAHMQSISRGGQVRRALPPQEEIEAIAPLVGGNMMGGFHEDRELMGVPEHIRHAQPMPPASAVPPVGGNVAGAPPPVRPQGPPPAATTGGPPTTQAPPMPPGMTPPASKKPAPTRTPAPAPAPPPAPPPVSAPARPPMDAFQQARERFGRAPMEDVRATMEDAGLRVSEDPRIAQRRMREFQTTMGDPHQTFLSDYVKSSDEPEEAKDRLVKAIEILQIEDAKKNEAVVKHLPERNMYSDSVHDVRFMAQKTALTPLDVKTILHSKGDWERITKTYGYSKDVVKVIKVSFGGI